MKKTICLFVLMFLSLMDSLWALEPGKIWDLSKLYQPPKAVWGKIREKTIKDESGQDRVITTQKVWYEGEPYQGKPTTIMAFYSRPKEKGPFPGLVLIHGGGGTAFSDWTEFWAARGYAAISMDHYGCEVDGEESSSDNRKRHRLPNGGPVGSAPNLTKIDYKETWPYHAVAAVIRAHSLLDSLQDVDPNRTGMTGLSWGGYLTALTAGIDDRFQTAVPVYGCGNLDQGSTFTPSIKNLGEKGAKLWNDYFDPCEFLGRARCKILFVNGTDDFAFPLDISRDSYRAANDADAWLEVNMPHSQPTSQRPEFKTWFDFVLKGGRPLPCLGSPTVSMENNLITVSAPIKYGALPVNARLLYSTDPGGYPVDSKGHWGKWQNRSWKSSAAKIISNKVVAQIPKLLEKRPIIFFLEVTDDKGNKASSHFERISNN